MSESPHSTQIRAHTSAAYALWTLALMWAGVIFWFSARTGSQIPGRFAELGHLGEYFVFGGLLYAALRSSGGRDSAAAMALIVASLYGVTDEFHQHFVVMRTPDVMDWAADTVGAAAGILAIRTISALRRPWATRP